ncbi:MAG: hypothetical protein ACKOYC_09510 [Bacteroidota bacterium]
MKTKFGVELVPVFRGDWADLRAWFKREGYFSIGIAGGSSAWYNGGSLHFGSMCGWDVTEDGKYALCRVAYEDYHMFKVVEYVPSPQEQAIAALPIGLQELFKDMQEQIEVLRANQEKIMQQLNNNQ